MFEFLLQTLLTNPLWVISFIVLCLVIFKEYERNKGLPPGPYGLPVIGYALLLDSSNLSRQIDDLCKRYKTDIVSVNVCGYTIVGINNFDLMKDVFQKRADVADRTLKTGLDFFNPEHSGIISTNGRRWKEIRRFSISALKDFGMGRTTAEKSIQEEAEILCTRLRYHNNKPVNPKEYVNIAVSNIICGIVFGQRFEHYDTEFLRALDGIEKVTVHLSNLTINFILRYKIFQNYLLKNLFESMKSDYETVAQFVRNRIKEHTNTYTGQKTDVIYSFLKEMEENRKPDIFDEKMLESLVMDYFLAGSESTHTTLGWCILAMAAFPDVQKEIQEELDAVIGDRAPCMNDKTQTPYTEATLSEVQRHYTLLPLGGDHTSNQTDIQINGFRIPKGSYVLANLNKFHHEKELWKNPDEFDPENFLQDGKVVNLDKLVPFSIGRRSCAGEGLARMELYLFFTTLVKNFIIKPETDDTKPNMVGVEMTVYQPRPFSVRMIPRN